MEDAAALPLMFKDAYAKIRRAEKHLSELTLEIADWKRTKTPSWEVAITRTDDGHRFLTWTGEVPGAPDCSGVIIGDVIHNLRAALDLMAAEMVRMAGENDKDVYFPFCDDADFLDKMIKKRRFHLAGEDAVALLKTYAPYKGGNVLLRAVHDLDVQDKHKAIIPHNATVYTSLVQMQEFPDGLRPVPVEGQAADMHLNFPDDGALAGAEILHGLHSLVETTKGVVEAFASLITSRQ